MAFDEALAARVRHALANRTDVVEKEMFGGVTFILLRIGVLLAGHICYAGVATNT